MLALILRVLSLLIGIVFLCITLFAWNRNRPVGCLFLLGGLVLFVTFLGLESWKWYQCRYTLPDEIKLVGHIYDEANSRPNNYLVILYREKEEIARDMTHLGKFAVDEEDEQNDGYFELTVPNEYQLTRCSMPEGFRQDHIGYDLPGPSNGTTFLWRNFEEIEAGTIERIDIEDRNKKYTLVVFPESVDHFPAEIANPTYLDQNGNVTINVEVMVYTMNGPNLSEFTTGQYVHTDSSEASAQGAMSPSLADVQYAWVIDGTTTVISGSPSADEDSVDRNNCMATTPLREKVIKRLTYIHQVKFEHNTSPNFDLAMAALKAGPSLGFMHGQMGTEEVEIDVDVPAGAHKIYMVYWYELWKTGKIKMAVGPGVVDMPFRALSGVNGNAVEFLVDCP